MTAENMGSILLGMVAPGALRGGGLSPPSESAADPTLVGVVLDNPPAATKRDRVHCRSDTVPVQGWREGGWNRPVAHPFSSHRGLTAVVV